MISALPFISQHQRANWRQGTRHFTILKRSEGIVDRCGPLWTVVDRCGPLWTVVGMISRRPASFCQRKAVVCSHYPSLSQNDLHGCRNLHQSVQYSSMMFNELLGYWGSDFSGHLFPLGCASGPQLQRSLGWNSLGGCYPKQSCSPSLRHRVRLKAARYGRNM